MGTLCEICFILGCMTACIYTYATNISLQIKYYNKDIRGTNNV